MREMKDSGIEWIGTIPKNWKLLRIQYGLYEIKENNTLKKTSQVLSLVKDNGVMLYEEKGNKGNKSKEDISQYKIAYPNTLIVNSMNILIGSVGISKYTGCVSPVYYVFKETEQTDLRFINYIFNTREFQKELRKFANGILEIRLRVSANDIFRRKIPFPDRQTQKVIADFLDRKCSEIDALTADIQTQIDTLEEYKKSVITEAVTKGLDPNVEMKDSGIEWIGKIPSNWTRAKIKNICSSIGSGTTPTSHNQDYYEGEINWIQSGDLYGTNIINNTQKKISTKALESLSSLKLYKPPFISIAMYGASVGNLAVSTIEACCNQAVCCLKTNDNFVKNSFLFYWLTISKTDFLSMAIGGTQPNISQQKIRNQYIYIPRIEEQLVITDYLDQKCSEIDQTISEKQQQLETLAEYKKSLIYEYVTGKREVA